MPEIPKSLVRQIRNRADIVNFVSARLHLRREGQNYFAHCPFHTDNTPSFCVSPIKQIFKCFSCGRSGNVFRFVEITQHVSYFQAIKIVASQVGTRIPKKYTGAGRQYIPKVSRLGETIIHLNTFAAKHAHFILMNTYAGEPALDYLHKRGLTDDIIDKYQIGYEPSNREPFNNSDARQVGKKIRYDVNNSFLFNILRHNGHLNILTIKESGLFRVTRSGYYQNRFANRIVFPVRNQWKQVIGFSGRTLNPHPHGMKYLNSPETEVFHKNSTLFNLDRAKSAVHRKHYIILYEGFMDALSSCQSGLYNCVASMGTSLTINQIRVISRYTHNICVCYDGDQPGQDGIARAVNLIYHNSNMFISVVRMPKGIDPDEFRQYYGEKRFRSYMRKYSITSTDFMLAYLIEHYHYNFGNSRDVYQYLHKALKYIARVYDSVHRSKYINDLSRYFHISSRTLFRQLHRTRYYNWHSYRRNSSSGISSSNQSRTVKAEQWLLHFAITSPQYLSQIISNKINLSSDYEFMLEVSQQYWKAHQAFNASTYLKMISNTRIRGLAQQCIKLLANDRLDPKDIQYCKQIIDYHNQKQRIKQNLLKADDPHKSAKERQHDKLEQYMKSYRLAQKRDRLNNARFSNH